MEEKQPVDHPEKHPEPQIATLTDKQPIISHFDPQTGQRSEGILTWTSHPTDHREMLKIRCSSGCCVAGMAVDSQEFYSHRTQNDFRRYVDAHVWDLFHGEYVKNHAEDLKRAASEAALRIPHVAHWQSQGLMPYNAERDAFLVWKHVRLRFGAYQFEQNMRQWHQFAGSVIEPTRPKPNAPHYLGNLNFPYELDVPFYTPDGMACAGPVGALKGYLAKDTEPFVMAIWAKVKSAAEHSGGSGALKKGVYYAYEGTPVAVYNVVPTDDGEFDMFFHAGEDVLPLIMPDDDDTRDRFSVSTTQVPSDYKTNDDVRPPWPFGTSPFTPRAPGLDQRATSGWKANFGGVLTTGEVGRLYGIHFIESTPRAYARRRGGPKRRF